MAFIRPYWKIMGISMYSDPPWKPRFKSQKFAGPLILRPFWLIEISQVLLFIKLFIQDIAESKGVIIWHQSKQCTIEGENPSKLSLQLHQIWFHLMTPIGFVCGKFLSFSNGSNRKPISWGTSGCTVQNFKEKFDCLPWVRAMWWGDGDQGLCGWWSVMVW